MTVARWGAGRLILSALDYVPPQLGPATLLTTAAHVAFESALTRAILLVLVGVYVGVGVFGVVAELRWRRSVRKTFGSIHAHLLVLERHIDCQRLVDEVHESLGGAAREVPVEEILEVLDSPEALLGVAPVNYDGSVKAEYARSTAARLLKEARR